MSIFFKFVIVRNINKIITYDQAISKIKNNFSYSIIRGTIKKYLNTIDLKIYNDHIHLKCFKFLIMDKYNPKNNIFVIAVKNKRKIFHVLDFIYISNKNEFKKYGHNLCTQIGSEFNVMFCGQHFLHEKDALIPGKKLITKDIKSEVCMKSLPVNYNFDTLYSEFVY